MRNTTPGTMHHVLNPVIFPVQLRAIVISDFPVTSYQMLSERSFLPSRISWSLISWDNTFSSMNLNTNTRLVQTLIFKWHFYPHAEVTRSYFDVYFENELHLSTPLESKTSIEIRYIWKQEDSRSENRKAGWKMNCTLHTWMHYDLYCLLWPFWASATRLMKTAWQKLNWNI